MRTVKQLLDITQRTANCLEKMPVRSIMDFDNEAGLLLSDFTDECSAVRDKNLPLLQFNYNTMSKIRLTWRYFRMDVSHTTNLVR